MERESVSLMVGRIKSKIKELEFIISSTSDFETKLKLELILSNYYIALGSFYIYK